MNQEGAPVPPTLAACAVRRPDARHGALASPGTLATDATVPPSGPDNIRIERCSSGSMPGRWRVVDVRNRYRESTSPLRYATASPGRHVLQTLRVRTLSPWMRVRAN